MFWPAGVLLLLLLLLCRSNKVFLLVASHIQNITNHVNHLNGLAYKDDPTVLGWDVMNEPRCTQHFRTCCMEAGSSLMACRCDRWSGSPLIESCKQPAHHFNSSKGRL
jgi:hypothetical protein